MPDIIYLAGPMRGLPEYNFPSFREARNRLRDAGWTVLCPAERDENEGFIATGLTGNENLDNLDFTLPAALERCFLDVLRSDAVAVLPGWGRSEGARAEVLVALLTGRKVYAYLRHRPVCLQQFTGLSVVTRAETV